MKRKPFVGGLAILLAATSIPVAGKAQPDGGGDRDFPELHGELIHSDVPLYGYEDDLVPEHFSDDDGSFGCMSRVATGDWTIKRSDAAENDEPEWLRFGNYGVFHCAIVESGPSDRDRLETSGYRYSFFVQIGKTNFAGKPVELWILQSGMRPGSDYLLLARAPGDSLIESFDVLQRRCPAANRREGPLMDVWSTRYCSINSRRDLIALAKAMAKEPVLAKLTFVGPAAAEVEAEAEPPAN
ncbi:hypothetical protein [Sphingopyxis sp. MSC1_008]|uniref:hypothetical protein n=1 Tax=Sphingopyxis sp. MSC1_008 TaxID=2909265 RepID=UPI0020BE3F86|nr:hypothetical protein [Sphingopyxis sp. MSC1_008]